jgi:molybdopterin-biosynthesis enzyme MoeA-like protein
MSTANSSASKEVGTAALLVIGSKILSGRTKDQNIGYVAECLTAVGIDLKEVRVVGNEEKAIVDALNALRHRYTYVFTTGGIGPTHSDITADCVAKAFGVPINTDPRALDILREWVKTTGAEMNEARLRMMHPQARGSHPGVGGDGPNTCGVRAHDAQKLARAKRAVEDMLQRVRRASE